MSPFAIMAVEGAAPIVLFIIYMRVKLVRKRRKEAADELAGIDPHPPFSPQPEPPLNFLYRRFSSPQRAYLHQQMRLAKGTFPIYAWAFIIFFTSGLLPGFVNSHGVDQPLPQRVWYCFLAHASMVGNIYGIMVVLAAFVATSGLTLGPQAVLFRTRPFSTHFLFYARMAAANLTVLASLLTGMTVSILLLLIFYGPVWLHLFDTVSTISPEQALHLREVLQTSPPRLFLSLMTTAVLLFSLASAFFSMPLRILRRRAGGAVALPLAVVWLFLMLNLLNSYHVLVLGGGLDPSFGALFIYFQLGPPPPYAFALIPVAVSTGLLILAQRLTSRIEL
jgi:hypothetical protein